MDIIRKTKSVCPTCLILLDAVVIEREGSIFLSKSCPQHGITEVRVSKNASFYKRLEKFYFTVMKGKNGIREYELWLTLKCNMDCPICAVRETRSGIKALELSCSEIENFIKKCEIPFFILSGGEPTCREDLDKIIKILKKYHKTVTINTNGLKLTDIDYLNKLKNSGLDRVNLQFDGFSRDAYKTFRGADFLDIKLKVLANLKALNIPVILNATIARNVNEDAIKELVDFAAKNDFINGINFFTICLTGGARNFPRDNYIMPDEVIDILEDQTNHKITRENVYLFQKLHFAVKSLFSQRYCFYNQIYLLVRNKNFYEPIDEFIDLTKIEPWLDKYQHIYKKNKFLAKIFLVIALLIILLKDCSFLIIKKFVLASFSYFFKTASYLKTKRFFYISFSTGCDPYKMDYSIVRNCQNEIIGPDRESGRLEYQGRDGFYCLNLEKSYWEKCFKGSEKL